MIEGNLLTIISRIVIATAVSGFIGFEREYGNKPAGIRTHVLVCIGATVLALTERLLMYEVLYTTYDGVVPTISVGRLTAQVVSGIGFLGAGTIIVHRQKILGLTTAASIWSTAVIGLAIGYGFYVLVLIAFVAILLTLVGIKRLLPMQPEYRLKIKYRHRLETMNFITDYFQEVGIVVVNLEFGAEMTESGNVYTNLYTIGLKEKSLPHANLVGHLSHYPNILKVQLDEK